MNHDEPMPDDTEFGELTPRDLEPRLAPVRSADPFAVGTHGRIFINIDVLDAINPADLVGRPLFIGAELTHDEALLARAMLDDAAHDMRSKIAGALWRSRAATPEQAPANDSAPTSAVDEARTGSQK